MDNSLELHSQCEPSMTGGKHSCDKLRARHQEYAHDVHDRLQAPHQTIAIRNATLIDARGVIPHAWIIGVEGSICAQGTLEADLHSSCEQFGITEQDIIDAHEAYMTPGYIDIHAHGGWQSSFDDGQDAIFEARACHLYHGTTRQVLSLITNPIEILEDNLERVAEMTKMRPDVLGAHLEGPFLALAKKGAHDPACLKDPHPEFVERLLNAANGCLRQITLAVEREHGMEALRTFVRAGVHVAVGHSDADYDMAKKAFDAGADIMTHMFNAMNGLHHRQPGPIPAALEDPRVHIELINDGFHVQNPMLQLAFELGKERIALVTDAMSATDCPDGHYLLGQLAVDVEDGKARLAGTSTIAGSTLVLETSVQRAVKVLGLSPHEAVGAATLTPARALGLDKPNKVTGEPLGLIAPGYAADILLVNPSTWQVEAVWCAGRKVR